MPCTMVAHLYGARASVLLHAVCRPSTFDETLMAFVLASRYVFCLCDCVHHVSFYPGPRRSTDTHDAVLSEKSRSACIDV